MLWLHAGIAQALLEPGAGIESAIRRHPGAKAKFSKDHLHGALVRFDLASRLPIRCELAVGSFLVDPDYLVNHFVQLGVRIVRRLRVHEPQIDRRQPAVTDDCNDRIWIVRLVFAPLPFARRLHARLQNVTLEIGICLRFRRDNHVPGSALYLRALVAKRRGKVVGSQHVGKLTEHLRQFAHVHELVEARNRTIPAGSIRLDIGALGAEHRSPLVELFQAAGGQHIRRHEALHRVDFGQRVRHRRTRSHDKVALRVLVLAQPLNLHVKIGRHV